MPCPPTFGNACASGTSVCPVSPPSTSGATNPDYQCCPGFNPGLAVFNRLVVAGDYGIFGLGTRNTGGGLTSDANGTVTVSIPPNCHTVLAYLYWQVLCYDSIQANIAQIDHLDVIGTCIGIGPHTCWSNFGPGHPCNQPTNCGTGSDPNVHNRAYWADVSGYVQLDQTTGYSKDYVLSVPQTCWTPNDPFGNPIPDCGAFASGCRGMFPAFAASNGMTLVVVWEKDNGPTSCSDIREVIIAHGLVILGQDASCLQQAGYDLPFKATYTGMPRIGFVIGDAQTAWSDTGKFNGTILNLLAVTNECKPCLQIAPNDLPDGAQYASGGNQGVILATPGRTAGPQYNNDVPWPIVAQINNTATVQTDVDCLAWHVFCYSASDCRCRVHVNLIPDGLGFNVQGTAPNQSAVSINCQNVNVAFTDNCGAVLSVQLSVNGGMPQNAPLVVNTGDVVSVVINPVPGFGICTSAGPNSLCKSLTSSMTAGSVGPVLPGGGGGAV
jgi:hypothetical protein